MVPATLALVAAIAVAGLFQWWWLYAVLMLIAVVAVAVVRRRRRRLREFAEVQQAFRRTRDPNLLPPSARSWAYGAIGEERVGQVLSELSADHQVAHDVLVLDATGSEVANIDHLVTGPGGTVLVDAKYWAGTVMVDESGSRLWRSGAGEASAEATERVLNAVGYEAAAVPGGVVAIVIAVVGKGRVRGGRLDLAPTRDRPAVIVVHVDGLLAVLRQIGAAGAGRGIRIKKLVRASHGRLKLSRTRA